MAGRLRREDGDVGCNGPLCAQPPNAPGDRRGGTADLLGQIVGGLQGIVLQRCEQPPIELVQFLRHCRRLKPVQRQKLASRSIYLPKRSTAPKR
jgi:hypothetical protein